MKKLVLLITLIFMSMSLSAQESEVIKGDFIHSVYFWLKNPDSQDDRAAFEKSLKKFINSSKVIVSKHIGVPASTNREVIDNTYTYSLIISFKNKEMHDKYQEEEVHKTFISESQDLWKKVLIYDSINTLE